MKKLLLLILLFVGGKSFGQLCETFDTVRTNSATLVTYNSARINGTITHIAPGQIVTLMLKYVRTGQTDTATSTGTSPLRNLTGLVASTEYTYYYSTVCPSGSVNQQGTYTFTTLSNTVAYVIERPTYFNYNRTDSNWKAPRADTSLYRAPDTNGGDIVFKTSDGKFYGYNGTYWIWLGVDSAGIQNQLNLKVDSVTVSGDSLFYWINSVAYGYILPAGIVVSDSAWSLLGNAGTTAGTNFIGTTDSVDLVIKTKNLERFRVNARGALGVGTGTDYGTAGYLLTTNGATGAPAWVDPTSYLATIYNSDGSITDSDRYVDADAGGSNLYFGKNTQFGTFEIQSETFDAINSSLFRVNASDSIVLSGTLIHLQDSSVYGASATNGYVWTLVDANDGEGTWKAAAGGGSGTVNSGTQYRLGYYATTGTAISEAAAITASRALISDANGVPTHSTTTATQLGYLSSATGTTGTSSTNLVFSTSPTLVTPTLGVAEATSINTSDGIRVQGFNAPASGSGLEFGYYAVGGYGYLYSYNRTGAVYLSTVIGQGGDQIFADMNNNVGINNASPGAQLDITGTLWASGAVKFSNYGAGTATFDASGNISSVSDERLKTKIKPYNSGIKELMQLRPIQYSWNDKSGMETKGTYAGFSAQNVKDAIPLGTGVNADGYLSIQERAILATTVTALQEAIRRIEVLEIEIKSLKK